MTKLETFLRKKRVWTKFKKNSIKQHNKAFFEFAIRNSEYDSMPLHGAFVWHTTPEGVEFWEALAHEYYPILTVAK